MLSHVPLLPNFLWALLCKWNLIFAHCVKLFILSLKGQTSHSPTRQITSLISTETCECATLSLKEQIYESTVLGLCGIYTKATLVVSLTRKECRTKYKFRINILQVKYVNRQGGSFCIMVYYYKYGWGKKRFSQYKAWPLIKWKGVYHCLVARLYSSHKASFHINTSVFIIKQELILVP